MIEVKVSFQPDRERARADTQHWVRWRCRRRRRPASRTRSRCSAGRRPAGRADREPVDRLVDPDEHAARIAQYLDMGFTHLVFHAPCPEQDEFLSRYAAEILPRLRNRA